MLFLCFRPEARPLNPNMVEDHEMNGGPSRVHGGEVIVALNRGPVPPSAPSSCTIDSIGKCLVGA